MAVPGQRQPDGSTHVGYVDLSSETFTDVTAVTTSSSFGGTPPTDESPVFDPTTNNFYFLRTGSNGCEVHQFDVTTQTDHVIGTITCDDSGFSGGNNGGSIYLSMNHIVIPDDSELSPDSSMAGIDLSDADIQAMYFNHVSGPIFDPQGHVFPTFTDDTGSTATQVLYGNDATDGPGMGHGTFGSDEIYGWVNDHAILLGEDTSNFYIEHLPANYTGVAAEQAVLPSNTRTNTDAVLSPDGTSFVFESTQGDVSSYYRCQVAAGANPISIENIDAGAQIEYWQ